MANSWLYLRSASSQTALRQVFEATIRNSSARGRDNISPDAYAARAERENEWRLIGSRMRDGSYHFSPYRLVLVGKGKGKPPREISIPNVRDRVALKALAHVLQEIFPTSKTPLAQVHVSQVRKNLQSGLYTHFLRLDVKDFYPSMPHELIFRELKKGTRSRAILRLVESAITTPTLSVQHSSVGARNDCGVPQGIAISNIVAEIAMREIDQKLASYGGVVYRYVDDVLVLGTETVIDRLADDCDRVFREFGFTIHQLDGHGTAKSSVGTIDMGFQFLGYEFCRSVVRARKGSVSRLEDSLARACTRCRYALRRNDRLDDGNAAQAILARGEWFLNLIITGCVFEGHRRGWMAYYSQVDDRSQLKRLDAIVDRLVERMNLPFAPKSFVKVHRVLNAGNFHSTYIPNFDESARNEQERILVAYFRVDRMKVSELSDQAVRDEFSRRLGRTIRDLETDIAGSYR